MSRAFVREQDGDQVHEDLEDLPLSPHPNHVTRRGLRLLREWRDRLAGERHGLEAMAEGERSEGDKLRLAHVKRDLRYVTARLDSALPADLPREPHDQVAFGATVEVATEEGAHQTWRIVGEDEADPDNHLVSWVSPLARALQGAAVGDQVIWQRPSGDARLAVVAIRYSDPD
ncbi:MAG: GreA/GreB family elongation factor [Alphaproteobacteria bacterium]